LLLQVLGHSRGWVLRLLNYEDEVFAVVSLLLERHSLANFHATFAESLYGLKRQPAPVRAAALAAAAGVGMQPSSRSQAAYGQSAGVLVDHQAAAAGSAVPGEAAS